LNIDSTSYPDHGRYDDPSLRGKMSTAEPGIEPGTSWLAVRSSDHQATRLVAEYVVFRHKYERIVCVCVCVCDCRLSITSFCSAAAYLQVTVIIKKDEIFVFSEASGMSKFKNLKTRTICRYFSVKCSPTYVRYIGALFAYRN
jgi:hypothetical protein